MDLVYTYSITLLAMLARQRKGNVRFLVVTEEMDIGFDPRWYQSVSRPLLVIVSRSFWVVLRGWVFRLFARPSKSLFGYPEKEESSTHYLATGHQPIRV